jgi:hypothetical protein
LPPRIRLAPGGHYDEACRDKPEFFLKIS